MQTLNTESLVKELQKRHEIYLKPNDPIFAMITLNELLLANHQEQLKAALEQQVTDHDSLLAERVNKHLKSSEDQADTLMKAMNDSFAISGEQIRIAIEETLRAELGKIRTETNQGVQKLKLMSATISTVTLAVTGIMGVCLGFLLKANLP